MQITDKANMRK